MLHVVNISFVIPYFLGDQINYLNDNGIEFHIACTPDDKIQQYLECWNFIAFAIPIFRNISTVKDIKSILSLKRYIDENKIDLVVGHTPKGALIGMCAAYLAKVPNRIYFRHGIMFETAKGIKRLILILVEKITSSFATKVVCVSKSVLSKSLYYNISNIKKTIILGEGTCNGIDVKNKFNKSKLDLSSLNMILSKYNINKSEQIVIGFVGRLA